MDLVVDANSFFAALIKSGETERLFFVDQLHFYAPEFLMDEIEKYRQTLLRKTHRSEMEFERFMRTLQKKIHFIPMEEIKPLMPIARKISPDPNDTTYFAVALKIGASIWSNDKPLRNQNVVRIYTTKELIDLFPAA